MTCDEIIAAMVQAIREDRWSLLCDRLRELDGGEVFQALFPIAADAQGRGPAYDAACLLLTVNPACPVSCKEAIRAMLPRWDISIEEVPWYLAGYFGEEVIRRAIKELHDEPLGYSERVSLDTVLYWAEIWFKLSPLEVGMYERWRMFDKHRRAARNGTDHV